MGNNEIKALSEYRLNQAKENLIEAEALYNINRYKGASNRACYAIYSILALEEVDFIEKKATMLIFI